MPLTRRQAIAAMAGSAIAAWAGDSVFSKHARAATPAPATTPSPIAMFEAAPINAEKLTDTITVLSGPGGNMTVVLAPQGKVVVDSGMAARGKELVAAAIALDGKPVATLVNTHFHFDHTGGNAAYAAAGEILAHANTRKRLSAP